MNFTVGTNMSSLPVRETISTAVTKNMIAVVLCVTINYINGTMVYTFVKHEVFSETPRYMLFIHLVVNDMIQLTISVLMQLISYTFYTINVSTCCFLLMVILFVTLNTPLNLACMAMECYIAICYPLQHAQICTKRRTYMIIGFIWVLGAMSPLLDLFVLLAMEPIRFFHSSVLCVYETVFRRPYFQQKRDISHLVYLSVVWVVLAYTYVSILFAAKAAKSDVRKALNTIVLHAVQLLLSMLTYLGPLLQSALLSVLPFPEPDVRFSLYLIIHILPRFLSPVIYGLRDQQFCKYLRNYLCHVTINQKVSPS